MIILDNTQFSKEQIEYAINNVQSYKDIFEFLNIKLNRIDYESVIKYVKYFKLRKEPFKKEYNERRDVDEYIEVVKNSDSIRECLIKLDLIPKGGNYKCFRNFCVQNNIDISHFTGTKNIKKTIGEKIKKDVHDYLVLNGPIISSYKLKIKLISEKIFEKKCYNCNLTDWLGKDIPLELEHIDGNHNNNIITNLTLLCPNCHALTSTYRGKNKNTYILKETNTYILKETNTEISNAFNNVTENILSTLKLQDFS